MNIWSKKQAGWGLVLYLLMGVAQATAQMQAPADSVAFSADHVAYDAQNKRVVLTGNAVLRYRDMALHAGHIAYDQTARTVHAQAQPDSTGARTLGLPQFVRGAERVSGTAMNYHLDTERGSVTGGRAAHERKYYQSARILLDGQDAMNAVGLSFSTCDRDHVHYDFLCQNVRVLQDDKVIARSVTFRIGPVPVFWMPFFVFPIQQGRQSGLLTPGVGSNSRDGLLMNNVGYYYAPSDYWDAVVKGTFRERSGFLLESRAVYAVRNRLSGSVDLGYEHNTSLNRNSWRLNLQHQQRLNPTTNIRGSGQFTSSAGFGQRNSDNLYDYLNQQLRSSISFDKRWTEANRSIDGSLTYYRDLISETHSFDGFPRLSFRQGRRPVFDVGSSSKSWYNEIYYDLSGALSNAFTRTPDPQPNTENLTLQGLFNLNSQHRLLGWLDLNPSFSLNEQIIRSSTDTTTRRESYSAGIGGGATFYGIFQPHIGRLRGIRHRVQPRLTFNYNRSAAIRGGAFGIGGARTWGDPRRSLGMNLGNTLEVKTERDGNTRRFTLASLNVATGYDLDAPTRKWRPLTTSASIKPDQHIDMRLTMNHQLYDDAGNRTRPRLQSFTLTSGFRFQGKTQAAPRSTEFQPNPDDFGFERSLYGDVGDVTQPWRFSLTHHYSFQRFSAASPAIKRSWLKADIGLNPTRAFRVDYAVNFDVVPTRRIAAQSLSLYRDLHCWEARFSWYPSGFNRGFYFKINIKDIPQIKFEHRQGGFGI